MGVLDLYASTDRRGQHVSFGAFNSTALSKLGGGLLWAFRFKQVEPVFDPFLNSLAYFMNLEFTHFNKFEVVTFFRLISPS